MDFLKYIKDITLITMTLFVVIDIVGSIPVILDLKKNAGALQAGKAAWAAGIIMILFVFFGEGMLHYIGISVNAFAVAGALVIFFFAMEMILGIQLFRDEQPETASIVPLAFPLIAGAGSLTTILSLRSQYSLACVIIGIVLNLLLVYVVIKKASAIERLIGKNGLSVLRRIFGIILLAIAIQMFTTNLKTLL